VVNSIPYDRTSVQSFHSSRKSKYTVITFINAISFFTAQVCKARVKQQLGKARYNTYFMLFWINNCDLYSISFDIGSSFDLHDKILSMIIAFDPETGRFLLW
jgi:hypothetical protein